MRVAILTHNVQFGDAIGNQVAEKLAFFLDSGADVRVFAESGRRLHPDVAAHCRRLDDVPEGEGWHFLTGADLVIVEYGQSYRLLNLLPLLARSKPRIIFDYHGVTPPTAWGKQPGAFLTRSLTDRGVAWCADALLTHSLSASDDLQREIGYPVERTFSLGYPIDTSFWSPGAPETDLRSELGIGWAPLLLFVGRLAPNKRVPLLVEAVGRLRSRDVHLVVIGDTGDLYEEEAARCQRRAEELGVSGQVHLLGQVANYRLRDAYRSADLFVMPSVHEGFCLPVLEAMACGVPVLAARATALPETVGDAGLTFAADNVNDLSTQIERLLDPEPLLTSSPVSSAEMNDRQQATTDAAVPQPIKDVGRAMAAA
ncbi:MAG: glycosyltransferase family 4 protein, partial [Gemmataceae bacterium]